MRTVTYFVQRLALLLNRRPFSGLLRAVYALGLRRAVAALSRHPAVYSIEGTGSFFEGESLYGLSDIDLVIVLTEDAARTDAAPNEIALVYNRVRRVFPFLGGWSEKAESLIFLSDIARGFAVPESYVLRAKQGRLVRLYGPAFPADLADLSGPVRANEAVAEADNLLRIALTKGEVHTSNLRFWMKLFTKLIGLADALRLGALAREMRAHPALDFLDEPELRLFVRKSDPDVLLPVFLAHARALFDAVREREEAVVVRTRVVGETPETPPSPEQAALLATLDGTLDVEVGVLPSVLMGLTPRLNYFPPGEPIRVVTLGGARYTDVRALHRLVDREGEGAGSLLVRVGGLLFIVSRTPTHVDVVPLDPVAFANVYARLDAPPAGPEAVFEMPASVYQDQRAIAEGMFRALSDLYRTHTGWIEKLPFPCVYLEDDRIVLRDALHRMRVHVLHTDGLDLADPAALVAFLADRHPACAAFLDELLAYHRYLSGADVPPPAANNLFRGLLQFMDGFLAGADEIAVADPHEHLGITVGIITRNRAADLVEALDSLTRQRRPADEVLVVDNGSTDDTRAVVERFADVLPMSYHYLPNASIPNARNIVLDEAQHDIISFTDDDCVIEPGWLSAVEQGFLRADNVGIVGGWVWHEPDPEPSMIDTYYSLFHHNKS